jgi:hypothetical protein
VRERGDVSNKSVEQRSGDLVVHSQRHFVPPPRADSIQVCDWRPGLAEKFLEFPHLRGQAAAQLVDHLLPEATR